MDTMRRPITLAMAAAIVLLAGAAGLFFTKYMTTKYEYNDVKNAEESARSQYADAFSAIAEIQDSLNAIAIGDRGLPMVSDGLRAEQRLTQPNKREALERIAMLNAGVERTKEKIRRLEGTLHRKNLRLDGLEKLIATLKRDLSGKEMLIAQLSGSVDSLQTEVTGLQGTVVANQTAMRVQEQTIEEKRHELATVEVIVGTKKDLTSSGVITARGGALGLGRTLVLSGRFDQGRSTPLDTDQETIVRVPAAKVEILSPQPASSFTVQAVGGQTEIRILDPMEFRKVRHLVIMTKA